MPRKMKTAFVSGLAISLMALSAGTGIAADYVMKIGMGAPPPDPESPDHARTTLAAFEQDLEAASDGRIDVQIFWNDQLGKVENNINLVRGGQIEGQITSDGPLVPYYADVQILGVPYLFPTAEIAHEVLDGPAGQKLADDLAAATGIRTLGWMENGGFRHFSSSRPLTSIEDFQGLKMRTMSNPAHMGSRVRIFWASSALPMPRCSMSNIGR